MAQTLKLISAFLSLAGFALIGMTPAQARQNQRTSGTSLTASDKKHLLEDNFVLVKTVAAIPPLVQKNMLGSSVEDGMADAGQPFERTDMVGSKILPFARLIFAGTSPGYCFVYSEHGGIAYWTQLSLYRLSAGQAILVWRGSPHGNMDILSLPQLRDTINKGKLDNFLLPEQPAEQPKAP